MHFKDYQKLVQNSSKIYNWKSENFIFLYNKKIHDLYDFINLKMIKLDTTF